jgi:hypothetical protein
MKTVVGCQWMGDGTSDGGMRKGRVPNPNDIFNAAAGVEDGVAVKPVSDWQG